MHLKKKQIRIREMEIYALGAMNEENGKQLDSLLEGYRKMHFPGAKEKEETRETQLEQAKRLLAQEVDKVFIVRPIEPGEGLPEGAARNMDLARLHARQIADDEKARLDEARRWKSLPRKQRRRKR